jgi:hypothetical protein
MYSNPKTPKPLVSWDNREKLIKIKYFRKLQMNFDFTDVINFTEDKNEPEITYRTNNNIKNISNNRLFAQT